ncbi:MAG: DUF370 domain-containing protein [bacterium]|nr:DUF370 domain-containing protein [bacterium]
MYIHAGNNLVLSSKDVIGIFDMDNTTVSPRGRDFLPDAQKNGRLVNSTDELPVSFIVTGKENGRRVYLSSLSPKVLGSRAKKKNIAL